MVKIDLEEQLLNKSVNKEDWIVTTVLPKYQPTYQPTKTKAKTPSKWIVLGLLFLTLGLYLFSAVIYSQGK